MLETVKAVLAAAAGCQRWSAEEEHIMPEPQPIQFARSPLTHAQRVERDLARLRDLHHRISQLTGMPDPTWSDETLLEIALADAIETAENIVRQQEAR